MKYFLITFLLFIVFSLPLATSAAIFTGIWDGASCAAGGNGPTEPCSFCDALVVIRNIVTLLFEIAIPLATAMIVYGAIRLMLAGGSEENVKKSKATITNAVTGLVIALAAWVIVNSILHILTGRADFPWNQINCS